MGPASLRAGSEIGHITMSTRSAVELPRAASPRPRSVHCDDLLDRQFACGQNHPEQARFISDSLDAAAAPQTARRCIRPTGVKERSQRRTHERSKGLRACRWVPWRHLSSAGEAIQPALDERTRQRHSAPSHASIAMRFRAGQIAGKLSQSSSGNQGVARAATSEAARRLTLITGPGAGTGGRGPCSCRGLSHHRDAIRPRPALPLRPPRRSCPSPSSWAR